MVRGELPAAAHEPDLFRGLRINGFYDADSYVKDGDRHRGIVAATFEHPYLNAEFQYLGSVRSAARQP